MSTSSQQRAAFEAFLDGMHTADKHFHCRPARRRRGVAQPDARRANHGSRLSPKSLQTVSTLADVLSVHDILDSETHHAALFRLQIGDTVVSGMDYARLDADAKIPELIMLWRPLPSVVEMQGLRPEDVAPDHPYVRRWVLRSVQYVWASVRMVRSVCIYVGFSVRSVVSLPWGWRCR